MGHEDVFMLIYGIWRAPNIRSTILGGPDNRDENIYWGLDCGHFMLKTTIGDIYATTEVPVHNGRKSGLTPKGMR